MLADGGGVAGGEFLPVGEPVFVAVCAGFRGAVRGKDVQFRVGRTGKRLASVFAEVGPGAASSMTIISCISHRRALLFRQLPGGGEAGE